MATETNQFWMVWCPQGYPPTKQHTSAHDARMEAERLAGLNPGKQYFVLEATGVALVEKPAIFKTLGCPF